MTTSQPAVPTLGKSGTRRSTILAAAMVMALGGCFGETVIDTRSGSAFKDSVDLLSEDLSPSERKKFHAAIKTLTERHLSDGRSLDEVAEILGPKIGGKTVADAIAAADAQIAEEQRQAAEAKRQREMKALEAKITDFSAEISQLETVIVEQAERAKIVRAKFDLHNARYFWRESNAETYPLIDVEIANLHDQPIRTVIINARLSEPGGKLLVEGKLRYEFRSRLKPGTRTKMRFEPDIFGPWANTNLKDREDLVLSAEVENLTYPNGAELIRTFVVRGDDPVFRIETLKRRKTEAQAELEDLQAQSGQS